MRENEIEKKNINRGLYFPAAMPKGRACSLLGPIQRILGMWRQRGEAHI
jgi:hypothetical protein